MPAFRRTPLASGAAIGVLVLVLVGTFALLQLPDPERSSVASLDDNVRIAGAWAPSSAPLIRAEPVEGPFTAVRGTVYNIAGIPAPAGHPYRLAIQVPKDIPVQDAVLYQRDVLLNAWRAVPASLDASRWFLETEQMTLPRTAWAVGNAFVPAPSAQAFAALQSLVAVPPPGAVGYRAALLAATVPDDYVVTKDPFGSGGCEGRFQAGTERTRTSLDTTEKERVVLVWELGAGCAPGQTVRPTVQDAF